MDSNSVSYKKSISTPIKSEIIFKTALAVLQLFHFTVTFLTLFILFRVNLYIEIVRMCQPYQHSSILSRVFTLEYL